MDKLSDDHRECVHLVFYEGMSLAEVASVQGCPENTVKTRLFHARQKLKNCLRMRDRTRRRHAGRRRREHHHEHEHESTNCCLST